MSARVPDPLRIGNVNEGWRVMQMALAVERMIMGDGNLRRRMRQAEVGLHGERTGEADLTGSPVDLVAVAREKGRNNDGAIRQAIARMHSLRRIQQWNAQRAAGMADIRLAGILKLAQSEILHGSARIHAMLLGPESADAISDQAMQRSAASSHLAPTVPIARSHAAVATCEAVISGDTDASRSQDSDSNSFD